MIANYIWKTIQTLLPPAPDKLLNRYYAIAPKYVGLQENIVLSTTAKTTIQQKSQIPQTYFLEKTTNIE